MFRLFRNKNISATCLARLFVGDCIGTAPSSINGLFLLELKYSGHLEEGALDFWKPKDTQQLVSWLHWCFVTLFLLVSASIPKVWSVKRSPGFSFLSHYFSYLL